MSTDALYELHRSLEATIGAGPAATLMAQLPPDGFADVARKPDIDQLRTEMVGLKHELTATFRAELMAAVTSQTRTIVVANFSLVLASVGVAFAAIRLAG